jgi:hypothetical protein
MPNGSWKAKQDAKCPFYKSNDDKQRRILCEGIIDQSTVALTYCLRADYDTQLGVFCCEHFKKCEVYRMIMEAKYDEEE